MKLHIGVIDVPEPEGSTTGNVATILEEKYGLFSHFADNKTKNIAEHLAEGLEQAVAQMALGVPYKHSLNAGASMIEQDLKDWISLRQVENVGIAGVPTQAALDGTSLRTKGGKTVSKVRKGQKFRKVTGARRPSFIYSGVLEASLKAWIE